MQIKPSYRVFFRSNFEFPKRKRSNKRKLWVALDKYSAGQNSNFSLGGDGVGKFSINSTSGVSSALPGLDRETKDTYYLSITAQDGGTPPLTGLCAVRVFISDTNDNKPVFSPTLYLTSISEATPPGTDVISVQASDVDIGVNAEIEFSIVGGDVKTQFQVRLPKTILKNKERTVNDELNLEDC